MKHVLDFYYSGTESVHLLEKNLSIYNPGCSYLVLACFHLVSSSPVSPHNPAELLLAFVRPIPLGLLLL